MTPVARHYPLFLAVLFFSCLVAVPASCTFGQWPIPLADCIHNLLTFVSQDIADSTQYTVITQIRLPRALAAIICGATLSMAGCILQGTLHNPLADPFTMGISAGAACGASLTIAASPLLTAFFHIDLSLLITSGALVGSILALGCSLFLGHSRGALARENVILAGIAVASFLGAIVALVKALNEESVTSIVFWILGSLQGIGWNALPVLLLFFLPGALAALWGWRRLDVLSLGDREARGLGLSPDRCRLVLLLGASSMTAGCVAITGVIGFVGLVAPHILRLILGGAHGPLLLASIPAGGIFLLMADTVARTILDGGQELPVGVVTAIIGAPFFAFLVWRRTAP